MYKITFDHVSEIRMGSPYKMARIHVAGGYFPEASQESFQDKYAISPDGKTCFVIVWDTLKNQPGFTIWKVSDTEKRIEQSGRISGCCNEISYSAEADEVTLKVWEHPQGNRTERLKL